MSRTNLQKVPETPRQSSAELEKPGLEHEMDRRPIYIRETYRGSGKLDGKVALITGGDSGIGRAVAVHFAREGADVALSYLDEHRDAEETVRLVEAEGRRCITCAGDIAVEKFVNEMVERVVGEFGRLDILVNNAAEQHTVAQPDDVSGIQLRRTFATNIFAMFYLVNACLPHLRNQDGATILNTASVVAYRGNAKLPDYAATKGAIVAYTRSLAAALAPEIRVNAVAPGPIWTPLIPSTFPPEKVATFGQDTPMKRVGQPAEVATCYVFLASDDSSYITGSTLHPDGGEPTNS